MMRHPWPRRTGIVLLLGLLAGCASGGVREAERAGVQRALSEALADPDVVARAPVELAAARNAVAAAADARGAQAAELAAIARQRIEIAQVAADQRAQEERRAELQQEHAHLLLQAARRDARQARRELERQRLQAQIEAEQAERLLREAEAARAAGDQAAAEAAAARAVAAQSRRIAAAQARAAELARKEAELAAAVRDAEAGADPQPAADPPAAEPDPPPAANPARPVSLTLSDRSFESGRPALAESGVERLDRIVEAAKRDPDRPIRIVVHSSPDASGELARARAENVRAALTGAGIAPSRIAIVAGSGSGRGLEVVLDG